MPVARWTATAVDLSDTPAKVADYLGLQDVCRATKLAEATVTDAMLRAPIDDPANPKGAICRPAARIGGRLRPTPLWAPRQVAEYLRRAEARSEPAEAGTTTRLDLPRITPAQASARGLASIEEIADKLGRAVNTIRRYARDYKTSFPPEVAIAAVTHSVGPTPLGYRKLGDVARWVQAHESGAGSDVPVAQAG